MHAGRCASCDAVQPPTWRPGTGCYACAAPATKVRGGRVCPSCLSTAEGEPPTCGNCSVAWPGDDDWPVVRTLAASGVDKFALTARLEAMSPRQANELAATWSAQATVVDEAARTFDHLEAQLIGRGYGHEFRVNWLASLPLGRDALRQFEQAAPRLPDTTPGGALASFKKLERHPARTLMALVVARAGIADEDAEAAARGAGYGSSLLAMEAAAIFSLWRHGERRSRLYRHDSWHLIEAARASMLYLDHPGFRLYAAVALRRLREDRSAMVHVDDQELKAFLSSKAQEIDAVLKEALLAKDADLRLTAALILGDEPTLLPFTKDADQARRDVALARYAALEQRLTGSRFDRLRDELRSADEVKFRQLVRKLPGIDDPGVLAMLAEAYKMATSGENRHEIVRHVVAKPYADLAPERRAELLAWLGDVPLSFAEATELVRWTLDGREDSLLEGDPLVMKLVDEAGRALRAMPRANWGAARDAYGFREWLKVALRTARTHLEDLGSGAEPFLDAVAWLVNDEGMTTPVLAFAEALWRGAPVDDHVALAHALRKTIVKEAWSQSEEHVAKRFVALAAERRPGHTKHTASPGVLVALFALFHDHVGDVYDDLVAASGRDASAMIPLYEPLVLQARLEPYDLASRIWPDLPDAAAREAFLTAVRAGVLGHMATDAVTQALPPFKLAVRAIGERLIAEPRDPGWRQLLVRAEAAWKDIVQFAEEKKPDGWNAHYFTSTADELREARTPVQKCDEEDQKRTATPAREPEPVVSVATVSVSDPAPPAPVDDDDLDVGSRIAAQLRHALDAASSADERRSAAASQLKAAEEEAERQRRLAALRVERQKILMEEFQKQSRDVSTDPALTPEERGHKLQKLAEELQAAMQQLGE